MRSLFCILGAFPIPFFFLFLDKVLTFLSRTAHATFTCSTFSKFICHFSACHCLLLPFLSACERKLTFFCVSCYHIFRAGRHVWVTGSPVNCRHVVLLSQHVVPFWRIIYCYVDSTRIMEALVVCIMPSIPVHYLLQNFPDLVAHS